LHGTYGSLGYFSLNLARKCSSNPANVSSMSTKTTSFFCVYAYAPILGSSNEIRCFIAFLLVQPYKTIFWEIKQTLVLMLSVSNYVPQTKFGRHIVFAPFLIILIGNCGKVCPTDSDFLAYLVPLDVDVFPIKFHQFLFGE
jgi:hypothetical protein